MATVTVNHVTYEYFEASFGRNRGIELGLDGADDRTRYQLRPNPHDNRKCNKAQARFYLDLATAMATWAQANQTMPPDDTVFEVSTRTTRSPSGDQRPRVL